MLVIIAICAALVIALYTPRGAIVELPKEVPAPIDFGDSLVVLGQREINTNRVRFPDFVYLATLIACLGSATANAAPTETVQIAPNCILRIYDGASSIEWTAKQTKADLTEEKCEEKANQHLTLEKMSR